ncbi:hypothetical protein EJ02DRAFT_96673 [Clathrospora elynae]|uniref:Uncharacterized protein n=1 Tax=Clathrospora elynae TaxID=706981 RepID=A0A6A5S6S5_9PLEO|nr:hypothetical protein EJ02DRAFT_96673 [Clathrospora elynae]
MLTPGLTRSQFLNSPQLKAFLSQRGFVSVEQWHSAFANKSRISTIIKREKMGRFPFAGGVEGVVYEWRTRHQIPETAYIRQVLSGISGDIIICFYDAQVKILFDQNTFQMDVSYKRLRGAWAEILIAVFHPRQNTLLTLGRIITNTSYSSMYQLGISSFFRLASERVGRPAQWRHLHGSGFYGVMLDMCSKQMSGLGRYLTSLDPAGRDWRWQLSNCTRFCLIHFTRTINTACGPSVPHQSDSVWGRMMASQNACTSEEYYSLLDLIASKLYWDTFQTRSDHV